MSELPSEMVERCAIAHGQRTEGDWATSSEHFQQRMRDEVTVVLHAAHVPELLEALGFYEAPATYGVGGLNGGLWDKATPIGQDRGAKARAVLGKAGVRV